MSYVILVASWVMFLVAGFVYGNIYASWRYDNLMDDIEEVMEEPESE